MSGAGAIAGGAAAGKTGAKTIDDRAALSKAAHAFEAVFLRQMIGSMRQAKLGDELFGSGASDQFRDMSDAKLADDMAGKFGIAALLEKQLGKTVGAAAPAVPAAATAADAAVPGALP